MVCPESYQCYSLQMVGEGDNYPKLSWAVFFYQKLILSLGCTCLVPSLAGLSATSLSVIPQWAGLHCRTTRLSFAISWMPNISWGRLSPSKACWTESASDRNTTCWQCSFHPKQWWQPALGLVCPHCSWNCWCKLVLLLWRSWILLDTVHWSLP